MNIEIQKSASLEIFTDRFRIANIFHVAAAIACGTIALGMAIYAIKGGSADGWAWFKLLLSAGLVGVAAIHLSWAARHQDFTVTPEKTPWLGGSNNAASHAYVDALLRNGMPTNTPHPGALTNFLYKKVPWLRHAPRFIDYFAAIQAERLALAVFITACFLLSAVMSWSSGWLPVIAYLFFLVTLAKIAKPTAGIFKLARGKMGAPTEEEMKGASGVGIKFTVAMTLAFAFIAFAVNLVGEPSHPLALGPVAVYTFIVLCVSIISSYWYFKALVAQTRGLDGTRTQVRETSINHIVADPSLPFLAIDSYFRSAFGEQSANAFETRRLALDTPQVDLRAKSGDFRGYRLFETSPKADSHSMPEGRIDALKQQWASEEGRYRLLLSVAGLLLLVISALVAVDLASTDSIASPRGLITQALFALALFSCAEYAFTAAHLLWQRFDFTSEVVLLDWEGKFSNETQMLKDTLNFSTGIARTGSELAKSTTFVLGSTLRVCVASVRSVCFTLADTRSPVQVVTDSAKTDEIVALFCEQLEQYKAGQKASLATQAEFKGAYIPALGDQAAGSSQARTLLVAEDADITDSDTGSERA